MDYSNEAVSCFFSGHRIIAHDQIKTVKEKTERFCTALIERHNVKFFICGGAIGFDTLAAETVIKLRDVYPQISLRLFLPCANQSVYWRRADVRRYERIIRSADEVVYITDGAYTKECMHKRNRAMVDAAKFGIVYYLQRKGGTSYTIDYAKKRDRLLCFISVK